MSRYDDWDAYEERADEIEEEIDELERIKDKIYDECMGWLFTDITEARKKYTNKRIKKRNYILIDNDPVSILEDRMNQIDDEIYWLKDELEDVETEIGRMWYENDRECTSDWEE